MHEIVPYILSILLLIILLIAGGITVQLIINYRKKK